MSHFELKGCERLREQFLVENGFPGLDFSPKEILIRVSSIFQIVVTDTFTESTFHLDSEMVQIFA